MFKSHRITSINRVNQGLNNDDLMCDIITILRKLEPQRMSCFTEFTKSFIKY